MAVVSSSHAAATHVTESSNTVTPGGKRKLGFKMVEDTTAEDRESGQRTFKNSQQTPKTSQNGHHHKTLPNVAGESQSIHHHLSLASGRQSPHIPPPLTIPAEATSVLPTPLRTRRLLLHAEDGSPVSQRSQLEHSTRPPSPLDWAEPGKVYAQQYLPPDHDPTKTYMLKPHTPNPSKIPDYHAPDGPGVRIRVATRRRGMEILRDACLAQARENLAYAPAPLMTPLPSGRRSPHMNNEEPITLSTYPDARPIPEFETLRIERDDFPAPPYLYADPERRERLSRSTSKGRVKPDDIDDEVEGFIVDPTRRSAWLKEQEKLKREAEELKKISSGIGKVFLHSVEERARNKGDRSRTGIDPRNASRTASANREPVQPPRYGSPAFASPSRLEDRPRPWEEWGYLTPQHTKWRSTSSGASTLPSYNIPRPGYSFSTTAATTPKSGTIPHGRSSPGMPELIFEDGTFVSEEMFRTQSGEFASTTLPDFLFDRHRHYVDPNLVRSRIVEPYYQSDFLEAAENVQPSARRQRKIYPVEKILITNRKLPEDVDRNHLELHLCPEDFLRVFQMAREDFYRLPDWRKNELKRRAKLF